MVEQRTHDPLLLLLRLSCSLSPEFVAVVSRR
jgi:hypothetical protein